VAVPKALTRALPDTLAGIAAVLASFLTMYAIGARVSAGPSTAILSAVLALTLSRRPANAHVPVWLTFATLPAIAIASALVGHLLKVTPALGAVLFVAALFVSIWLRQFGRRAAEIGRLIALPFVVMLVVPVGPNAPGGPLVNIALAVCAGLVALGWVTIVGFAMARMGYGNAADDDRIPAPEPRAPASRGLSVSTRMALQMGVALTAAFVVGFVLFPQHWGWVVLTAFIVCSGARGRGDAAYKGLLRLGGAIAGTIGAAVLGHVALPNGVATACAIFAALFLGMWLRERNYAYWAACITLVLALLQRSDSEPGLALLLQRLEGIFAGALCAVAATWFVYPIRTESVVRRRVAGVLAALEDLFGADASAEERARKLAVVEHRVAEMNLVAPPVELHRRLFARSADEHPAAWIALVRELLAHARARVESGIVEGHEPVRRAIRHSRRSIGRRLTPEEMEAAGGAPVTMSLRRLRDTFR
jgi:Fusaric acid resistance protein-like